MNLDHIYIISWFGRDPKLRKFRKEIHEKQLDWCRTNNLKITVLAQEYLPEDYHPDVEYVHSDIFLRPCGARNELFKRFYAASDEDFAIFADNDTIIVDEVWGKPNSFIDEMRSINDDDLVNIDFVGGINPAIQAYSDELAKPEYKNNIVFRRTNRFSGGFFILKNLRKHRNTECWFDDASFANDKGEIIPGEEGDFCINLLMNGLNCFQNFKAVFNDMATAKNSTWADGMEDRSDKIRFVELINKKYDRELITLLNETEKTFNHVGYSTRIDKPELRFCVDKKSRMKVLVEKDHKNIVFYDLPYPMVVKELMQWAKDNTNDELLLELLEQNSKKEFKRLGNPRTRFNWNKLHHPHPMNILIKK